MPLTPADVREKQFSTTRLRSGYNEEEVDAFLDEVEAELSRLIQENEALRADLVNSRAGMAPTQVLSSPVTAPAPAPEPERRLMPRVEDTLAAGDNNVGTAARILALAQNTADQAIADARQEADELLGRAGRRADDIRAKARREAEQVTDDARARADSVVRDAQERHRQAMGSLVQQREALERRVGDLRVFEREYRTRLKGYVEGPLRDMEAHAKGQEAVPAVARGPELPLSAGNPESRNGDRPTG
jgi:DivIVA domain-containing protein